MHWRRKWQPTPVFLPGESQDGEAWWAAIYGVAQSRTQLKRLSSSSSSSNRHTQSTKTRPGADCGSDHELCIAKFRLKLKKVGKTTRQFKYDLNQIPYDYTVEVRNRFKGLDLIDIVPDELWNEVCDIVQETGIKTIPKKKKCKKSKMAVWGGLTNSCEKKRSEKQRREGKI